MLNPEREMQEIWRHLADKKLALADEKSKQLCLNAPSYAGGWFAASVVAMEQGQLQAALKNVDHALQLNPNVDQWTLHKARLYLLTGKRKEALDLALVLSNKQQKNLSFYAELGLLFNSLGEFQKALECYQNALKLQSNNPQIWFNLASVQRYLGKLTDAQYSLDQVIKLNPHDSEAWLLRSSLSKQTSQSNHISGLQDAVLKAKTPLAKSQLLYAMGKEFEDLQRYEETFKALKQGANVRRANMQYSLENDLAVLKKIREVYNSHTLNSAIRGCDNNEPIFILGLPRTGSTLVERIIANHSAVYAAGELNNFAISMMQQVRQSYNKPPRDKLALIEATSKLEFSQLGSDYIKSTRPNTGKQARFIDKLPLNSLYVGLIRLALPKAKIIYVERHPLDTFFAIFKQCFTQGYPFSYDLNELCEYQIEHYKLMQHWQSEVGQHLYTVRYEALVNDLEGETRNLLLYCDLPFEQQCCDFNQNQAPTTTASASQVRQALYTSSIGKWKHFSQQLADVKLKFEAAGIKCD